MSAAPPASDIRRFRASGFSMEPFLLAGDELIVKTPRDGRFAVGDILLYRSAFHRRPVAHRLVRIAAGHQYLLRSDAHLIFQEWVPREAILGRVEWVRRGNRLFAIRGNPMTETFHWAAARLYPIAAEIQKRCSPLLEPAAAGIQRQKFYRRLVSRLFTPSFTYQKFPHQRSYRLTAAVGNRYAGAVAFERQDIAGARVLWISSLYVQIRYRGAGIASRLIQEIETFARPRRYQALWVSYENSNRAARQIYEKLNFQPADDPGGFWEKKGYGRKGHSLLVKYL